MHSLGRPLPGSGTSDNDNQKCRRPISRVGWALAGTIASCVGVVAWILPVVPGIPLILLAGYFFSKSSDKLERRMRPLIALLKRRQSSSRNFEALMASVFSDSGQVTESKMKTKSSSDFLTIKDGRNER